MDINLIIKDKIISILRVIIVKKTLKFTKIQKNRLIKTNNILNIHKKQRD